MMNLAQVSREQLASPGSTGGNKPLLNDRPPGMIRHIQRLLLHQEIKDMRKKSEKRGGWESKTKNGK